MAVETHSQYETEEHIFDIEDKLIALEGAFYALLLALKEADKLPLDAFSGHMASGANYLEDNGLKDAAAAFDLLRDHIVNSLLIDSPQGCTR